MMDGGTDGKQPSGDVRQQTDEGVAANRTICGSS